VTQVSVGLVDRAVAYQALNQFRLGPCLELAGDVPSPERMPRVPAGDTAGSQIGLERLVCHDAVKDLGTALGNP
jgi:hypothetical protein